MKKMWESKRMIIRPRRKEAPSIFFHDFFKKGNQFTVSKEKSSVRS